MQTNKAVSTSNSEKNKEQTNECFVIMPISDSDGYEKGHFKRVYEDIFKPAIIRANFKPYRADENNAASLIQLEIIQKLIECPMAICDLSSRNPNVLFELGVRQAFDKPVVLVQECDTPRIFDISSINTIDYRKERIYHEVMEDQERIYNAIVDTFNKSNNGKTVNSIVQLLSIKKSAKLEDIEQVKQDPAIQFVISEISALRAELRRNYSSGDIENRNDEFTDAMRRYKRYRMILDGFAENGGGIPKEIMYEISNFAKNYKLYSLNNPQFIEMAERFTDLYMRAKYINRNNVKEVGS